MARAVHRRQALGGLCLLAGAVAAPGPVRADRKHLPPALRQFSAPGGGFRLEVAGAPGWPTPEARATLVSLPGGARQPLWSRLLVQAFGPGEALVNDAGQVLLIDEGQRRVGPVVLELVGRDGTALARHGIAEVVRVSGLDGETLVRRAKEGPWMSAPPVLLPSGDLAVLEAGGVALALDMQTGLLSRR